MALLIFRKGLRITLCHVRQCSSPNWAWSLVAMSGARSVAPPNRLPLSGRLRINLDGLGPLLRHISSATVNYEAVLLCAGLTAVCCCVSQFQTLLSYLRQAAVGIGGCIPAYFVYVSWPRGQPCSESEMRVLDPSFFQTTSPGPLRHTATSKATCPGI